MKALFVFLNWIAVSCAIAYACNGLMRIFKKKRWLQYVISVGIAIPMWLYFMALLSNMSFEWGVHRQLKGLFMIAYGISGTTMTVILRKRWELD